MKKLFLTLILIYNFCYANFDDLSSMNIREFAELVSYNDHINIIVSDEIKIDTSIFIYKYEPNLIKAFEISLNVSGYELKYKDGFYYVDKKKKNDTVTAETFEFHTYQLRSHIYDDIKNILSNIEHNYITSSNRIVFKIDKYRYNIIKEILDNIDKPILDYNFKISVFQFDKSNFNSSGVDLSAASQFSLFDTNFFFDLINNSNTNAVSNISTDNKNSFYSIFKFLRKKGFINIDISTVVYALDNKESYFNDVQEVPVLEKSQNIQNTNIEVSNSYNYKNVDLSIKLKPNYITEDTALVDLNFELSNVTTNKDYLPTFSKKEIKNFIKLKKGSSILLGGFNKHTKDDNSNSVPGLSSVPFIGYLFKNSEVNDEYSKTYILIEYNEKKSNLKIDKYIENFDNRMEF